MKILYNVTSFRPEKGDGPMASTGLLGPKSRQIRMAAARET
jgi:hypothetical protein